MQLPWPVSPLPWWLYAVLTGICMNIICPLSSMPLCVDVSTNLHILEI